MSQPAIRGVLPVFQTPFLDDDSIDFEHLEREIAWLLDHGAQGIVMAMVSEVLRLSTGERLQMAEFVCKVGRERGVVIISVGSESCHTSVCLTQHAAQHGAHAVMAIPPLTVALSDQALFGYYERILDASALPVIVQDASGYVGRPLSLDLQIRLHQKYPQKIMFKPEAVPIGPRLSELQRATDGQAIVFEGSGGAALVDSYRRGVRGTMPGADLIRPLIALWDALERGDENRAARISLPLVSLVALLHSLDAYLAVEKHLLRRQGVFSNTRVRGPVGYHLDELTRREVDRLFDMLLEESTRNA